MRYIVATILLALTTISAQAQSAIDQTILEVMEAQNEVVVDAAARGFNQQGHVEAVGAHAWKLVDGFAESTDQITILLVDLCMTEAIAVAQAAADLDLLEALVLSGFGAYTYQPEFLAGKTDDQIIVIDRGLNELVNRHLSERT